MTGTTGRPQVSERSYSEALGDALDSALSSDERVIVLSGTSQDSDASTIRLRERHGEKRILGIQGGSEDILGVAFGMAVAGLRPVADVRFNGPSSQCYGQIVDHISRIGHRSGHRFTAPMVIRIDHGRGSEDNDHRAEIESALIHVPGLKVVVPSNPQDAHGLFLEAISDAEPVAFLEPVLSDRSVDHEISATSTPMEIGSVRVEREGDAVTLLSWGAMMAETREAAVRLGEEGVSAEVIDVRTLSPLDRNGIVASVNKTGRVVVVEEGPVTAGVGGEIAAAIQERCLYSLLAPVQRIARWDGDFPGGPEATARAPQVDRIVEAVMRILS